MFFPSNIQIVHVNLIVLMAATTVTIQSAIVRLVCSPVDSFTTNKKLKFAIKVVEENPDWNRCIDDNSLKLGRCIHACDNNQECEDDCLSRFKTRQLNCPCEVSISLIISNDS